MNGCNPSVKKGHFGACVQSPPFDLLTCMQPDKMSVSYKGTRLADPCLQVVLIMSINGAKVPSIVAYSCRNK